MVATWMDQFFLLSAFLGSILWFIRVWPRKDNLKSETLDRKPMVSIIVPARNEVENLKVLLPSLMQINYPNYEVIVVDDESTDETRDVAASYGVKVISGKPRPKDWAGKPWACHQGFLEAKGEFLLFTDADTLHLPESLNQATAFMEQEKADLASAIPYHANPKFWAQLMGPFQSLLLALTAPYQKPNQGRVFAIGQYLMFRRSYYEQSGGHTAVKEHFAEDLALAKLCIKLGARYRLHWGQPWFWVDMYASLSDFLDGWRRNFRQGMKQSGVLVFIETILLIAGMTGSGQWFDNFWVWIPVLLSMYAIYRSQKTLGHFSFWGLVLFPFGLLAFIWVSLTSTFDQTLKRHLVWKQRAYSS